MGGAKDHHKIVDIPTCPACRIITVMSHMQTLLPWSKSQEYTWSKSQALVMPHRELPKHRSCHKNTSQPSLRPHREQDEHRSWPPDYFTSVAHAHIEYVLSIVHNTEGVRSISYATSNS